MNGFTLPIVEMAICFGVICALVGAAFVGLAWWIFG